MSGILSKSAYNSLRLLRALNGFMEAAFSGFWLGLLNSKGIGRINDLHYEKCLKYVSDEYNLSGLQRWEHEMLSRYFSSAKQFLIIGAGGGRETAALRKWERVVDSYECSKKLVEYANDFMRRNNSDASVTHLPKNSVPGVEKKYDGIIIGWGAYSHIFGSLNRISLLSSLKSFCNEDTRIMISFLTREGNGRRDKITKNVSNFFRFFSGGSKIETGDRLLSYYAHFFDRSDIENELNAAGFRMIEYSDSEYGCIITEKR